MDKDSEELLAKTHHAVLEIKTFLLGAEGSADKGMCGDFYTLKKNYEKFKLMVYVAFGILIGSGIFGISVLAV